MHPKENEALLLRANVKRWSPTPPPQDLKGLAADKWFPAKGIEKLVLMSKRFVGSSPTSVIRGRIAVTID